MKLSSNISGLVLGVVGILLWFAPWAQWQGEFMGQTRTLFQSGQHMGGIAYVVLLAAAGYALGAWQCRRQLQLLAAGVWLLVAGLHFARAGGAAWGLCGLLVTACLALLRAVLVESAMDDDMVFPPSFRK